jgi:pimeloyl-ACP methyl ester carboxylesterase
VITNAAQSIPNVKALVYIDAHALAEGESMLDVTAAQPGSALGVADPSTVFDFVQYPGAPEGDVDTYIKPELFAGFFAAKLPKAVTATLAASQSPVTLSALSEKSGAPAWARIPSFFFIGSEDKILPPAEQEFMAKRAHGYVERGRTDHLAMLEAPSTIVKLVDRAAK